MRSISFGFALGLAWIAQATPPPVPAIVQYDEHCDSRCQEHRREEARLERERRERMEHHEHESDR